MSDYTPILESVSDPVTGGIFTYLKNNVSPVPEYLADTESLNIDYYYRHSGNKIASPLITHFLDDEGKLTTEGCNRIAKVILNAYKDNWDKVYNALTIDYSPIENVDETLTETTDTSGNTTTSNTNTHSGTDNHSYGGTDTRTNTGTDTSAQSGTDTRTDTGTDTSAQSGTDTVKNTGTVDNTNAIKDGKTNTKNNIYGYNSSDASADTEQSVTVNQTVTDNTENNLTETTEHGLTDTRTLDTTETIEHGLTDTRTLDTTETTNYNNSDDETINITDDGSGKSQSTGNEKHDLRRHGNVGVTTNQQMITEELKLRQNTFIQHMFNDVDTYLALSVY